MCHGRMSLQTVSVGRGASRSAVALREMTGAVPLTANTPKASVGAQVGDGTSGRQVDVGPCWFGWWHFII